MKFQSGTKPLHAAVSAVSGALEGRVLPILGNILLSLSGQTLTLTATDMEIQLQTHLAVEGGAEGAITVPGRKLGSILAALDLKAAVGFDVQGDACHLKAGRSRFKLATIPADNFPAFSAAAFGAPMAVPGPALARLLGKTSFAMAQQDVRYYLNGLYLEGGGGVLRAVASDGHRLALCEAALAGVDLPGSILPRKAVSTLLPLTKGVESVLLSHAPNALRFELGAVTMWCKLIEGRFPDYQRVMPRELARTVDADRAAWLAVLRRVALLSNEKYKACRVWTDEADGALKVSAENPEHDQAEDALPVTLDGSGFDIGFNVAYLSEALDRLDSETVRMGLTDNNNAALLTDAADDSYRYVVMPMRL